MQTNEISTFHILNELEKWESTDTIESLEQNILKTLMEITSAKGGSLIISYNNTFYPKIIINNNFLKKNLDITVTKSSPLSYVAKTLQPLLLTDIESSERFQSSGYKGYSGKSLLIFPLFINNDFEIRYFTLHSPQKCSFDYKDLQLGSKLTSFALRILQFRIIEQIIPKVTTNHNSKFMNFYNNIKELTFKYHNLKNVITPIYNNSNLLNSEKLASSKLNAVCNNLKAASLHAYKLLVGKKEEFKIVAIEKINAYRVFYTCKKLFENENLLIKLHLLNKKINHDNICFWGNKNQIEQLIINFFKNSIEAMKNSGEINVYIDFINQVSTINNKRHYLKNFLCITISDKGTGINPLIIKNMCRAGISTKKTGSGIGMTSVQQILKAHKGMLEIVNKNKNEGAEFKIYLPSISHIAKNKIRSISKY